MVADSQNSSNIPIPDPSVITAQEIAKAKAELRDEFKNLVTSAKENITTRIDGIDKASIVLSENVNRVPTLLDRQIETVTKATAEIVKGMTLLNNEKFDNVDTRFKERDERSRASEDSNKLAIKDALQAQKESAAATQLSNKEAIGKSEDGFKTQIGSLDTLITTARSEFSKNQDDLKERVVRLEQSALSTREVRTDTHGTNANIGVIFGIGCGIFGTIIGMGALIFNLTKSPAPSYVPPAYSYQAPPSPTIIPPGGVPLSSTH